MGTALQTLVNEGKEAWIIGVDSDMYEAGVYADGKSVILTSALKEVGNAAYDGIGLSMGEWSNETAVLTFANKGVGLPAENPNLDAALVKDAEKALTDKKDLVGTDSAAVKKVLTIKVNGKY